MSFEIITNFSTNSHFKEINKYFPKSDEITIISPFLMDNMAVFFRQVDIYGIQKINLITTLLPQSIDQLKKVNALISLIEFDPIKTGSIQCRISINNKLHGIVYFFKKGGQIIAAIISSANFTNTGLSFNHECGVLVRNEVSINKLEKLLLDAVEYDNISHVDLYKLRDTAIAFEQQHPNVREEAKLELNLAKIITNNRWTNRLKNQINYWLKPIGYAEGPVTDDRFFDGIEERLHFSKIRPSGVQKNDILVAYGVGAKRILSIYQSISEPKHVTEDEIEEEDWLERWPWYITGKNLTPKFGLVWSEQNVYLNNLVYEFTNTTPEGIVTSTGSRELGALNWGKDKIRLSPAFANFVIDKIVSIEDSL